VSSKTKATNWHAPFKIVYDCNEQIPYTFQGFTSDADHGKLPIVVDLERRDLETADYTIDGLEDLICIERKSGDDMLKTLLNGKGDNHRRDNFFKELDRMQAFDQSLIVVEADFVPWLRDIPLKSSANPKSIARTILAIQQDFRTTQWAWCHDRPCAEKYTFDFLHRFWKKGKKHANLPLRKLPPKA
jgi:ERCC4-type nuclease